MFRKVLLVIALVFAVYSLTGCQTVQGIGEDITAVGEACENLLE